MADVTKIKLPNNNVVNIKDYRIPGVDQVPTSGSVNLVTSGGVYQDIEDASLVTSAALNDLNDRLVDIEEDWVTTEEYSQIESAVRDTYTKQEIDTMLAGVGATETDPVFSASPAAGITAANISSWNSKTSNTGTVIGSSLTADKIILGDGDNYVYASGYSVTTTAPSNTTNNTNVPTSGAVYSAINSALTSVLKYKGTIGTGGTVTSLPASHAVGDVYVVSTAGTYAGKACEVGDYIICKTAGSSASDAHWDVVNGENQVENKSASLAAAGSSATIATVDGTNITVTTPSGWTGVDKTGTLTGVSFNGTSATVTNGVAAITATIPAEVTESTVSGWGFTKNAGTLTTETDPVFSASAAAGITSADITNWNGKTSNTGTITGITMNGVSKGTSGVVNLGTVITSETALSKGTTTGSGNAVTDVSVSGHQITLSKGSTFLTSETSLSKGSTSGSGNAVTDISVSGHQITLTKGSTFLTSETQLSKGSGSGSGNVVTDISVSNHQITLTKGSTVPVATSANAGKIPRITSGGAWEYVTPSAIYSGSGTPSNSTGNNGDVYLQTS